MVHLLKIVFFGFDVFKSILKSIKSEKKQDIAKKFFSKTVLSK